MPRKTEEPRINTATVVYNGDKKLFNTFIESMIAQYLNSGSVTKSHDTDFSDKVEVSDDMPKSLDKPK